jgi:hypothetical protein
MKKLCICLLLLSMMTLNGCRSWYFVGSRESLAKEDYAFNSTNPLPYGYREIKKRDRRNGDIVSYIYQSRVNWRRTVWLIILLDLGASIILLSALPSNQN